MEPVLCNSGGIAPEEGYLAGARELCRRHGALLIFDEVITGFRMGLGGAQGHYGVTPDLATFGKAVAGGLPLSVVAGRREIMERMFGGGVVFGGTFNGNPLSLAGADACLTELERGGGAALAHANAIGMKLQAGIAEAARRRGVNVKIRGFGAAFALHFDNPTEIRDYRDTLAGDAVRLRRFLTRALEEGVHMLPDGRMYVSAAHTAQDVEETVAAVERALEERT
jgi:glutamate-1-semialdehyde 2,1-aminomutase